MAFSKTLMKKPTIFVWLFFLTGILFFAVGNGIPESELIHDQVFGMGIAMFGGGIVLGLALALRSKKG